MDSLIRRFLNLCLRSARPARPSAYQPHVDELLEKLPANSRFTAAVRRIAMHAAYRPNLDPSTPYSFFHQRPIIGENTPVIGRIFLSHPAAEALIIDESYSLLRPVYASFRARFAQRDFSLNQELALVQEAFKLADVAFEANHTELFRLNYANKIAPDTKVALDFYLEARIGVSRHKVLLAAYLIEKLREEGRLNGTASLSGEQRFPDGDDEMLVYTFRNGASATFDPRSQYGKERTKTAAA